MSIKGKDTPVPAPMLKNAASAPVIYFDNVPAMGGFGGNVEIELAGRLLMPGRDGVSVTIDMGCVAHLRCSRDAAAMLRDSITKVLEMLDNQANPERKVRDEDHQLNS
jgi:hypothetical protein